jgi:hypothetical protein
MMMRDDAASCRTHYRMTFANKVPAHAAYCGAADASHGQHWRRSHHQKGQSDEGSKTHISFLKTGESMRGIPMANA